MPLAPQTLPFRFTKPRLRNIGLATTHTAISPFPSSPTFLCFFSFAAVLSRRLFFVSLSHIFFLTCWGHFVLFSLVRCYWS